MNKQVYLIEPEELHLLRGEIAELKAMLNALLEKSTSKVKVDDELLTIPEITEQFSIHRNTIKKLIADGLIASAKTSANGQVRVLKSEIVRYFKSSNQVA